MKKYLSFVCIISLLLVFILTAFALVSCDRNVVSWCDKCGESVKSIENFNPNTGYTEVYYECTKCGHKFGAGKLQ